MSKRLLAISVLALFTLAFTVVLSCGGKTAPTNGSFSPVPAVNSPRLPPFPTATLGVSPIPATLGTQVSGTGKLRLDDSQSQLPSCPAEVSQPLFDTMPMDPDDFIAFRPLGFLSPPIHMFPAKHSSFAMALPGQAPPKKPVRAPGKVWVTEVWEASFDTGGKNFQVYFYPCREFRAYFYHLSSISEKLARASETVEPRCVSYNDGRSMVTTCRHERMLVPLESGEQVGIGTDTAGVDFGALDNRIKPASFVNLEHYSPDYPFYVSPVNYFRPEVRAWFEAKLGSVFGNRSRTAEPEVGSYMQDIAGTAQGNWFFPGVSYRNSTDMRSALGLVHDYVDPAQPILSIGNSIKGLTMGLYSFKPEKQGLINRDFDGVKADGATYCYDRFLAGQTAGGMGLSNPHGILLLTMPDDKKLKVEKVGTDGSTCESLDQWTFMEWATSFER